jgi:hypothetical protein
MVGLPSVSLDERAPRSLRVLFVVRAANYERQFERLIRGLLARGHSVHVVAEARKTLLAPGFSQIFDGLAAETPRFTWEQLEGRRADRTRPPAGTLRRSIDYLRFLEPQFEQATGLHARASSTAPFALRQLMKWRPFRTPAVRHGLDRRLRKLESAIPPVPLATETVAAHRPDVMLIAPFIELGGGQVDYLRAARAKGIPVVLPVASWDNLTNKGLIRDVPDLTIVWNEAQVTEAVELHRLPKERVVATGAHSFDHWFDWHASCVREEFLNKVGLPTDRPYLMYVCSSSFVAGKETAFVDEWLRWLRAEAPAELREVGVMVRPHPQNVRMWHEHKFTDPWAVVFPPRGAVPSDEQKRSDYFDSLHHAAAVVGINTSALIEAAIARRAIFTIRTETHRHSQGGTVHFQHLTGANDDGVLITADSWSEHFSQLAAQLEQPELHRERIDRFLADFLRPNGLERPTTPIAVAAIEQVVEQPRVKPAPPGPVTRMLMLALIAVCAPLNGMSKRFRNSRLGLYISAKRARDRGDTKRAQKAMAKARKIRQKRRQRMVERVRRPLSAVRHGIGRSARRVYRLGGGSISAGGRPFGVAGRSANGAVAKGRGAMATPRVEETWTPDAPTGVFVLGAPRGGTSAITRVVNMLGVPIPDAEYLKPPDPNNPTGFWEVPELSRVNHAILHQFGVMSMAPRPLPDGWLEDPEVLEVMYEVRELSARRLGPGPWVFKTALTSLTLPFWVRCLNVRPVIVLPVRHPIENASSLRVYVPRKPSEVQRRAAKPSMSMPSALAIWERYIRASFVHAAGYPTYVSISSDLVDDPATHARDLGRFLEHHGAVAREKADPSEIVSFIRPDLRHHTPGEEREDPSRGVITDAQVRLWRVAQRFAGGHDRLPALDIGEELPSTELLMNERLFFEEMQDEFRAREKGLRSQLKKSARRKKKREAESKRSQDSDAEHLGREAEKKAPERELETPAAASLEEDTPENVPSDLRPAHDAVGQRE